MKTIVIKAKTIYRESDAQIIRNELTEQIKSGVLLLDNRFEYPPDIIGDADITAIELTETNKAGNLLLEILACRERIRKATTVLASIDDCFAYGVFWNSITLFENCKVINNELYDAEGNRLASDGLVDNLYFCNQSTGYAADDYSGYIYIPVNGTGSYIGLHYEC